MALAHFGRRPRVLDLDGPYKIVRQSPPERVPPAITLPTTRKEDSSGATKTLRCCRHDGCGSCTMDPTKIAQMVEVLNGLTARDALYLLFGCMQAVLGEAPSDEERGQSLDDCIDLLRCTRDRL
jgi:hypothetical protein